MYVKDGYLEWTKSGWLSCDLENQARVLGLDTTCVPLIPVAGIFVVVCHNLGVE